MKCVEKKTVLWALLFIFFLPAQAQYVDRNKTTLYVGMALPRTNLSEYAEQGVNVGIRQVIPLRRFFSLMVSAEMFRNRFTPTLHRYGRDLQRPRLCPPELRPSHGPS